MRGVAGNDGQWALFVKSNILYFVCFRNDRKLEWERLCIVKKTDKKATAALGVMFYPCRP